MDFGLRRSAKIRSCVLLMKACLRIQSMLANPTVGLVVVLCWVVHVPVLGQGTIDFDNLGPNGLDARVTFLDGTGVGVGFTAQLFFGPPGMPVESLQPLLPTTTFQTGPADARGYVVGRSGIPVPGTFELEFQTFVMRAYNGSTWETSTWRGESNPVTVRLDGGTYPSAYLYGLQPFHVVPIPEPSVFALAVVGGCLLGLRRKPRRHA